jgi:hypothetical protein
VVAITDENGLFDASGHELITSTGSVRRLITIDRRVDLSLSSGERVLCRFLLCDDKKLGCMVGINTVIFSLWLT